MDAFKSSEIKRMQLGGNKAWQTFFNTNSQTSTFEEATIKERYDCEVGEEYKERLSAKVEEREFDKPKFLKDRAAILEKQAEKSRSGTPAGVGRTSIGSNTGSRTASPAPNANKGGMDPTQKAKNEAYFARMGDANASRPDNLPPSQGGKYGGFGSAAPEAPAGSSSGTIPSANEFQKDPVAALTKGFGWFSATVSKQAKMVNDSYIQPTAKNLATTDFAAQARTIGTTVGQGIQTSARGAAVTFNKFVEGQDEGASNVAQKRHVEPERKDFWDSFGVSNEPATAPPKPSNIGTSAMKNNPSGGEKKKDDGWGDDW